MQHANCAFDQTRESAKTLVQAKANAHVIYWWSELGHHNYVRGPPANTYHVL